jgi:hypothetical protein
VIICHGSISYGNSEFSKVGIEPVLGYFYEDSLEYTRTMEARDKLPEYQVGRDSTNKQKLLEIIKERNEQKLRDSPD